LDQNSPTIGIGADGRFVIAWTSGIQDGFGAGVFAQRFLSDGQKQSVEFQVNTNTLRGDNSPAVGVDAGGDFIVAWFDSQTSLGIWGQRFSSLGSTETSSPTPTRTPTPTATSPGPATVTSTPTPSLTPTITTTPVAGLADADGNGSAQPLTDGLLVLRYLFGFRGATLTTGAVDSANCTRCTAGAIEAHIAANLAAFDIDGNASVQPLTDSLLVLRYLFGFRGPTLTAGAVDLATCTRCTAATIETYIASLLPS
jgi:hypothetical protein